MKIKNSKIIKLCNLISGSVSLDERANALVIDLAMMAKNVIEKASEDDSASIIFDSGILDTGEVIEVELIARIKK